MQKAARAASPSLVRAGNSDGKNRECITFSVFVLLPSRFDMTVKRRESHAESSMIRDLRRFANLKLKRGDSNSPLR